jgi:hypothetical protein
MKINALAPEIRPREQPHAATVLKALARFLGRQAARDLIKADHPRPTPNQSTITEISEE